jgi:hypothetical protein
MKEDLRVQKKTEKLAKKLKKVNKIFQILFKFKWDFQATINQLIFEMSKFHKIN